LKVDSDELLLRQIMDVDQIYLVTEIYLQVHCHGSTMILQVFDG
jgi:hypothetical protein